MALPVPNLDDRRFQDLVDDAKRLVQQRCPEWTDHNVSDPGVTLIELFAWMTDQVVYRLNRVPGPQLRQVPRAHRRQPLSRRRPPARPMTFWLSAPAARRRHDPAGTQVATVRTDTDEAIAFTTIEDLPIIPSELAALGSMIDGKTLRDHMAALEKGTEVYCFQKVPSPGDALYIGLSEAVPSNAVRLRFKRRHRRRRRRPDQPAARLGGLDRRRLGAVRARLRLHRRPQPRRRRRHPRPARPRGVADREAAGRLAARAGRRSWPRASPPTAPRPTSRASRRSRSAAPSTSSTPSSSPTRRSGSPRACPASASCSSAGPWCPATTTRDARGHRRRGLGRVDVRARLRRQRPGRPALHARPVDGRGPARAGGPPGRRRAAALRRRARSRARTSGCASTGPAAAAAATCPRARSACSSRRSRSCRASRTGARPAAASTARTSRTPRSAGRSGCAPAAAP